MKRTGRRIPARHRSRRAPPRRPGAKRTSTRKHRQKRNTPGKAGKGPGETGQDRGKRAAKKPPGLAKKAVRGARTEAWFYVHNKIHEVEHENVGVEGAHKSELAAEAGTRKLTRYAKRRWQEHPARKVAKWERKDIKPGPMWIFRRWPPSTRSLPAIRFPVCSRNGN